MTTHDKLRWLALWLLAMAVVVVLGVALGRMVQAAELPSGPAGPVPVDSVSNYEGVSEPEQTVEGVSEGRLSDWRRDRNDPVKIEERKRAKKVRATQRRERRGYVIKWCRRILVIAFAAVVFGIIGYIKGWLPGAK